MDKNNEEKKMVNTEPASGGHKRFTEEEKKEKLNKYKDLTGGGLGVVEACKGVGVSYPTMQNWLNKEKGIEKKEEVKILDPKDSYETLVRSIRKSVIRELINKLEEMEGT